MKEAAADKVRKLSALEKANIVRRAKLEQRQAIEKKVEMGMPITEEERALLAERLGKVPKRRQDRLRHIAAAAVDLVVRPKSVTELRLLVEKTAAKHSYNPIEKLIELVNSDDIEAREKVAIHKALLPYLTPQLAAPKPEAAGGGGGVKVTITRFEFPKAGQAGPLHQEKPATVATTEEK